MRISTRRITAGVILAALAVGAGASRLAAHFDGVSGRSQSATGCSCHASVPNENGSLVVDIVGPTGLVPSATGHFTLTVIGGPTGTTGGLDIHATSGTLVAGTGTQMAGTEVVQIDNTRRSWNFDWKAPAVEGTYSLHAIAMASNDDGGTGGDSWNWFGGAAGVPFAVVVNQAVAVDPLLPLGLDLESPYPSPSVGPGRVSFTLPRDTRVTLEILDVHGRRAALLVDGVLTAGRHTVLWNGRDVLGGSAPSGIYWLRLSAEGGATTRRWTLVR